MDGDDRVLAIVLTAEHLLDFAGFDLRRQFVERAAQVVRDRLAGLRPLDEHVEIFQPLLQRLSEIAIFFESSAALHDFLRACLILPEVWSGNEFFDLGELGGGTSGVKDGFAGRRRAAPDPHTYEAGPLPV
jgi:hypothetical protein